MTKSFTFHGEKEIEIRDVLDGRVAFMTDTVEGEVEVEAGSLKKALDSDRLAGVTVTAVKVDGGAWHKLP